MNATIGGGLSVGRITDGLLLFLLGILVLFWYPGIGVPPEAEALYAGAGSLPLLSLLPLPIQSPSLWLWKSLGAGLLILFWLGELFAPRRRSLRIAVLSLFVVWTAVLPTLAEMRLRHLTQPWHFAHDGGVLQTEAAVRVLAAGGNPYRFNYAATPLGQLGGYTNFSVNPALTHLVYLPASFLMQIPCLALVRAAGLPADARWLSLAVFLAVFVVLLRRSFTLAPAIVWSVSPLLGFFLIRGTNDHLMLGLLLGGLLALRARRPRTGGALLALACGIKLFAWAALPLLWLWLHRHDPAGAPAGLRIFLVAMGVLVVPFLLWSPAEFLDDVIAYPLGWSRISYPVEPIGNFGSGPLRQALGLGNGTAAVLSAAILILVLLGLLRRQARENTLGNVLLHSAVLLLVAGWLGPILHDNYLGVFLMLALLGATLGDEPVARTSRAVNATN